MSALTIALSILAQPIPATAGRLPIIDMHLHARRGAYTGDNPPPMCAPFAVMPRADHATGDLTFNTTPCAEPIPAAASDDAVLRQTIAAMERFNIYGVVSGEPELMESWIAAASDRIIPAVDFRLPGTPGVRHVAPRTTDDLRRLHARGRLRVLGEIMAQYEGVAPNDPRLEPFWALAEELDLPVAIHMGEGEPGQPFSNGGYRVALGNPLLLEEVLVRHPRLRLSVMHAGYPMAEEMRALLFSYPHVYVDVGGIVYTEPRPAFYAFLRSLVEAGYGDRIMFGSDQMIWPGTIAAAIRTIEEAPFLSTAQKRDIFYNNAARFLRLDNAEIERHHGRR